MNESAGLFKLSLATYDTWYRVAFGFCYVVALQPWVQVVRKLAKANAERTSGAVLVRGVLTIFGLGCLHIWYAVFFRKLYASGLPPSRLALDGLSFVLFGIGANLWDNRRCSEILYCIIQATAILTFEITCIIALHHFHQEMEHILPLVRAIVWCTILLTNFLFAALLLKAAEIEFAARRRSDHATVRVVMMAIMIWASIAGLAAYMVHLILLKHMADPTMYFGVGEMTIVVIGALVSYVVVGIAAVGMASYPDARDRLRAIIATYLPMAALICVTLFSWKYMW